eukprot:7412416-Alexandrium_andersonii.AAC.1
MLGELPDQRLGGLREEVQALLEVEGEAHAHSAAPHARLENADDGARRLFRLRVALSLSAPAD